MAVADVYSNILAKSRPESYRYASKSNQYLLPPSSKTSDIVIALPLRDCSSGNSSGASNDRAGSQETKTSQHRRDLPWRQRKTSTRATLSELRLNLVSVPAVIKNISGRSLPGLRRENFVWRGRETSVDRQLRQQPRRHLRSLFCSILRGQLAQM